MNVAEDAQGAIQAVIDDLSVAIRRPVLLDDPSLVPLAYSPQWGRLDRVRNTSIMSRRVPDPVRRALLDAGIAQASDVVRIAADATLGMTARICVPVRAGSALRGYVWLLDPEGSLADVELEQAQAAARRVAQVLAVRSRPAGDDGGLIQRLVADSPAVRATAVAQLRAHGVLGEIPLVLALLSPMSEGADPFPAAVEAAHRLSVGYAMAGRLDEGAAVLASPHDPVLRTVDAGRIGAWLYSAVPSGLAVAQSAPVTAAELAEAHRQARIAVRSARACRPGRNVAAWAELGPDRLVARLPPDWRHDVPARLLRLIDEDPPLRETLAVFLDNAGDVGSTASALSLHRSGVYYRLGRIEELTGMTMSSGTDRLLAHMALRADQLGARRNFGEQVS